MNIWAIRPDSTDSAVRRFKRYLENEGFRPSTVDSYVEYINRYIKFCGTPEPVAKDISCFRDHLLDRNLSRSTINNYSFAIRRYHKMIGGDEVKLPFLKRNECLPNFFTEDEVLSIFDVCTNLKHLSMLKILFFGCLRASELCNLDDADLDLRHLTLRVREGKGGRDGVTYITEECARTIRQYLEVRPPLIIENRQPLFYTDFNNRWNRINLYRMFAAHKERAGITKRGGLHVFSRHTPATIMISKGCDIRIVKEVLRHKDIRTTLRYAHLLDHTVREWYNKTLRL